MPLYEYFCPACKESFETLRPAAQADQPTACPACRVESNQRILSLVSSSVMKGNGATGLAEMSAPSMGGACCGGACGCSH